MKILWLMFSVIGSLYLSTGNAAKINIQVTDSSGEVIKGAQVHFNKSFIKTDTISFDVSASGRVQHTLPDESAWLVSVTAPNKEPYISYIMIDGEKEIDLKVQLPFYKYLNEIKNLKIIHSDVGLSSRKALPLTKTNEYTYAIEIKTDNELKYQISQLLEREGYIHGQIQDRFEYDGRGGYLSVIKPTNGVAKITIDTRRYQNVGDKLTTSITPSSVAEKAKLMRFFSQARGNWNQALDAYVLKHGNRDNFVIDESKWLDTIEGYLQSDKPVALKHIAAMGSAYLYNRSVQYSDYAFKNIPVDSPLWNLFDGYVSSTLLLAGVDMTDLDKMMKQGTARVNKLQFFIEKFVKKSPYTDTKKKLLMMVNRILVSSKQYSLAEVYLDMYKKHLSEDKYYIDTLANIDRSKKSLVGKTAPSFHFPSLSTQDKAFKPETFKGKYLLVDFWATWCSPCIAEMSVLHAANEQYKLANFEILSVSIDEHTSLVNEFRKGQWSMPWHNSWINEEQYEIAKEQFNINGIPKAILIDPTGNVIAQDRQIRGEKLHQLLDKLLNKKSD
jgi:thiol-disulfide isomerase/thioredoxin